MPVAVSFLPIYLNIKEKSRQEAKAFTSRTITDIFLLAFVLSGILYLAAPLIMKIMLPSYTVEALNLAVSYFRILIWGMCFYMSNQLLQSLLNAEKQYGYSSFTAMLNNLILTGAVVALGRHFGLWAMGGGCAVFLSCTVLISADQESEVWIPHSKIWIPGFTDQEDVHLCVAGILRKCDQ